MAGLREELLVLVRAPLAPWIWFTTSVLTLITGPFGTYDSMSFAVRSVFWPGLIAAALLFAYTLCAVLSVLLPRLNVWAHDLFVAVIFSVLFLPVVSVALRVATAGEAAETAHFLEVLAISVCVAILHRLAKLNWPQRDEEGAVDIETFPSPSPSSSSGSAPVPRLLRRLEAVHASEVLRLTVQDHYVEVVLIGRPSQRILMRFTDAVDEIEGLDGLFVHRSHWVVRAHILGAVTENGREMVEMIDGSRVPVSRTYRSNLDAAGIVWLERDRVAG